MPSQPTLPEELVSIKAEHITALELQMGKAVGQLVVELLTPQQELTTIVEVAVGLERLPILVRVLESYLERLKNGGCSL